jgi:alkanesulfonate monooxygenase SsuD/methylene tetrahydromethanopterin reductase-like flavin-dependent oxidoreductase (luciferase family)
MMRFDVEIPNCREAIFTPAPFAGPEQIVETVVEAERLGYETVWATDFISPSPASGIGPDVKPNWYEPIVALAFAAARTQRIRLGTGVVMMPYRDTVMLAKQSATLDQFSGGRFVLGMGLGAFKDEFNMVRPRDKKVHRGRLLDEQIAALLKLFEWQGENVDFAGEYVEFHGLRLDPKPLQKRLPIYLPCRNEAMIERAAKWQLGAMFHAADANSHLPLIAAALERNGRVLQDIDIIGEAEVRIAKTHEAAVREYGDSVMGRYRTRNAPTGSRVELETLVERNWIGTVDEVVQKIGAAKEAGLEHINALHLAADSMQERLAQMQVFAEEVMPRV